MPENSYANTATQLSELWKKMENLEKMVSDILSGSYIPDIEDEYPEYVQPTGVHDAYHVGDKITYNDKRYTCVLDGCVWAPDVYPAGWEEVE